MDKPTKNSIRKAALILSIFSIVLFVFIPLFFKREINIVVLISIKLLLINAVFFPYILLKPYLYWIKFGIFLGKINKKVVLIIFFYFFIVPFGLLLRFLRKMKRSIRTSSFYKFPKDDNENFFDQY